MNSLRGGVAVFNYYLKEECNNNMICAAQRYKGIQSQKNMKLAYTLVNTYNTIMGLEKKRDPEAFGINGKKLTTKISTGPQNVTQVNTKVTSKPNKTTKINKVKKDKR